MKSKRVEILFDPQAYRTLEQRARKEGLSVGAMVREAVTKYVTRPSEQERREALRWLASQTWHDIGGDWEDVKQEIIDARVEAVEKSLEAS